MFLVTAKTMARSCYIDTSCFLSGSACLPACLFFSAGEALDVQV